MMVAVMESVGVGGVMAEKAMAMRRYHRIRQIGTVLRCAEVCAALVLLSWSSARVPDFLCLAGVFLRRLSSLLISTPVVFLLGNAIVLTLFAKSRHLSSDDTPSPSNPASTTGVGDIYEEFLKSAPEANRLGILAHASSPSSDVDENGVVYEDKAVCLVETRPAKRSPAIKYKRTRSDHIDYRGSCDKTPALRRSTTDIAQKDVAAAAAAATAVVRTRKGDGDDDCWADEETDEKEMNEELRRRVEAFIAKQLRLRREESIAMVAVTPDSLE